MTIPDDVMIQEDIERIYAAYPDHSIPVSVLRERVCRARHLTAAQFDAALERLWRQNHTYRLIRPPLREQSAARSKYHQPVVIEGYEYYYLTIYGET
jgi:hypothetical protein